MLPHWAMNLGPQPLGSDTLLSELLRHVLLVRSKICIYGQALLVLTKWFKSNIEVVQQQRQFKDIPMAQRAEHQIQMAEALGSVLIGVTFFLLDFFLFSHTKASDTNIAITTAETALLKWGNVND